MCFEKYECGFASYVDDNASYKSDTDLITVLNKLEKNANSLFTWLKANNEGFNENL